jgi:pimeloyl-ACP methyl ester carboxylesterase
MHIDNASVNDRRSHARTVIAGETTLGRNVIVVAHSYGGMVGNSAIKGFTRQDDIRAHNYSSILSQDTNQHQSIVSGHVVGLVLIASGFTLTGLSFMDPLFGNPPPSWRVNNETGFAEIVVSPRELFYHDLPVDEANYWISQLTPQSLKALFEGGEFAYAGWLDTPVWYVGTTEDRGLPVFMQRMQVGMAREMGGIVEHREMPTSHSPFLSQPDEVVGIMTEAIAAFTGQPVKQSLGVGVRKAEGVMPMAKWLKPYTWFRFGLPLACGHLLGRCFLMYSWGKRLWRSSTR